MKFLGVESKEKQLILVLKKALGLPRAFEDAESFGKDLVLTTDLLSEGDDFPLGASFKAMGWSAATAQLSDLAAAGAKPLALSFAWGLPKYFKASDAKEIALGMKECVGRYGCGAKIIGGDLNEAQKIILSGCAVGRIEGNKRVSRKGAEEGDLLCLTGSVGASAGGYLALKQGLKGCGGVVKAFGFPKPRVKEMLAVKNFVTACTDLSDGLAVGVHNLCEESRVGVRLFKEKIPVSRGVCVVAEKVKRNWFDLVCLGSDYELLFAVKSNDFENVEQKLRRVGCPLAVIGVFLGKKVLLNGRVLEKKGFQHFSE